MKGRVKFSVSTSGGEVYIYNCRRFEKCIGGWGVSQFSLGEVQFLFYGTFVHFSLFGVNLLLPSHIDHLISHS